MTTHIVCNKCKKDIECTEKVRVAKGTIVLDYPRNSSSTMFLDLCKDCYHKVVKFIKEDE